MANKKGTGLLMVWADVPAELEEEYNRWYSEEHIAQLLSIPGVLNAARYEAVKSGPKHLACYELESPAVFNSQPFQDMLSNPTPRTQKNSARNIGTNYIRNLYETIFSSQSPEDVAAADMSPVLQVGRMGISSQYEEEFNEWYSTVYAANYARVPGVIRSRRLKTVQGDPKYGVIYEFEHEKVSESPEWEATRDINPWSLRMRPKMQHAPGSPGVYMKTFQPLTQSWPTAGGIILQALVNEVGTVAGIGPHLVLPIA